ncbi:MAG: threonine-phosphate decarboxylase CobD [Pseudomonadota bacterium]
MTVDLIHGGALDAMRAAYPNAPEPWIDLSTGINPWPYPNRSLSEAALADLPTRALYEACRQNMAKAIGAQPDTLLLAPGSELLIRLLPDVIGLRRVAILSPTYGDHFEVWHRAGAEVIETPDPLGLASQVDGVVVTHPNNPDGRLSDANALEAARAILAVKGGWLIMDEAYADLLPAHSFASRGGVDGLIILRSLGKFFGLAGLRLGALIAPQAVRTAMADRLGVWPVSGAALEIGVRGYADGGWQAETRATLASAAARLDAILRKGGLNPVGGTSLFRYVEIADAYGVFERLAHAGIYVRRFAWSAAHLRIGLPANRGAEERLANAFNP